MYRRRDSSGMHTHLPQLNNANDVALSQNRHRAADFVSGTQKNRVRIDLVNLKIKYPDLTFVARPQPLVNQSIHTHLP